MTGSAFGSVVVLAIAVAACAPATPTVAQLQDGRTALRRLADSTERLVSSAVVSSDSAALVATLAASDTVLEGIRSNVLAARSSVERASLRLAQAVEHGERLRLGVIAHTRGSRQADDFERYWLRGREKLSLARAYSNDAVATADSALGCPQSACTISRTRLFNTQVSSASGATREAESLVRVAMRYVE